MEERAQALEDKGLFRRAAKIWGELPLNSYEADKQEYYRRRMDRCLEAVKRPRQLLIPMEM